MSVSSVPVTVTQLSAWISRAAQSTQDLPQDLVPGLSCAELLSSLVMTALEPAAHEIEMLESVPRRDDLQFDGRPMPSQRVLTAWLYAPGQKVAYALHTPGWQAPAPYSPAPPSPAAGLRPHSRQNWDALLREHFHSGQGWTAVSAVAMPVRVPFDEPGLKIAPLLALWAPVSPGEQWLGETMTTSVRHGLPHVVRVQIFSAALFVASIQAAGQDTLDVVPRRSTAGLLS
jgi:hypothetical protein